MREFSKSAGTKPYKNQCISTYHVAAVNQNIIFNNGNKNVKHFGSQQTKVVQATYKENYKPVLEDIKEIKTYTML